jgi:hypothetical protein
VLYDGQGRFHGSTAATVDYVVRQSGDTVANLRSFTGFLETAKAAGVGAVTLPADVKGRIDDVVRNVGKAADVLAARTSSNADKIRAALETVYVTDRNIYLYSSLEFFCPAPNHFVSILFPKRKSFCCLLHCRRKVLIVVAAAMLILAFLGLGEQISINSYTTYSPLTVSGHVSNFSRNSSMCNVFFFLLFVHLSVCLQSGLQSCSVLALWIGISYLRVRIHTWIFQCFITPEFI